MFGQMSQDHRSCKKLKKSATLDALVSFSCNFKNGLLKVIDICLRNICIWFK